MKRKKGKKGPVYKSIHELLLRGPITFSDVCQKLDLKPAQVHKSLEFLVDKLNVHIGTIPQTGHLYVDLGRNKENSYEESDLPTEGSLRFGIIGDTHLCSASERLDHLNSYYDLIQKEGIPIVYHGGDVVDGMGVYRGQENHLKVWGMDNQIAYAIANYPSREGIITKFIGGNHDLRSREKTGVDSLNQLTDGLELQIEEDGVRRRIEIPGRSDMIYLGQYECDVRIGNTILRLLHPDGGQAYAKSYKLQTYTRNLQGGKKPHILVFAHYHDNIYLVDRNIHCLMAGTFQDQTEFARRRGFSTNIGGWIVEIETQEDGQINKFLPQWIAYYK